MGRLRGLSGPGNVTGGCKVGVGITFLGWQVCLDCKFGLGMQVGSTLGLEVVAYELQCSGG